jgi:hypothetical protein
MSPPGPYERQERFTRTLTYVLAVVFYAFAYALAQFSYGPVAGFVVCSPILAAYGAWWILNRGVGARHWLRWLALREVNGNYHAFDEVPVRIAWDDGQCWVAAKDVFEVLREQLDAQTSRRLVTACGQGAFIKDQHGAMWFAESALLQWLGKRSARTDRRTNQFKLWLEHEAFPAMHKKEERTVPVSVARP